MTHLRPRPHVTSAGGFPLSAPRSPYAVCRGNFNVSKTLQMSKRRDDIPKDLFDGKLRVEAHVDVDVDEVWRDLSKWCETRSN